MADTRRPRRRPSPRPAGPPRRRCHPTGAGPGLADPGQRHQVPVAEPRTARANVAHARVVALEDGPPPPRADSPAPHSRAGRHPAAGPDPAATANQLTLVEQDEGQPEPTLAPRCPGPGTRDGHAPRCRCCWRPCQAGRRPSRAAPRPRAQAATPGRRPTAGHRRPPTPAARRPLGPDLYVSRGRTRSPPPGGRSG